MPDAPAPLTPKRLAELAAVAAKAKDAIALAKNIAPLPWRHGKPWPQTWITSSPAEKTDAVHVADVRGWGYLTGGGQALGMSSDDAFEVQKAWGDIIAAGVSVLPDLAALLAMAARVPELERERDEQAAIVARIWKQFGSPTYEQLAGRSIYDLIDAAQDEAKALREALNKVIEHLAFDDGKTAIGDTVRAALTPASDDKGGEG